MRFTLKDYQADAVEDVLGELASARDFYQSARPRVSSVALTATTGAGKTVMAAAAIEALFFGSDELDLQPDPGAVVLWFSDDPALNQQTLFRLDQASDRLRNRLVTVEHPFRRPKLSPGTVYFLNTSKLSSNSLLVRGFEERDASLPGFDIHPDTIPFTFWDTLSETINDPDLTLYLVLDEAHRGLGNRTSADKPTIVRRLINGHNGVPPVPIVWGISATVERFENAMQAAQVQDTRVRLRTVTVDQVRVQESGLLKDDIILEFPAEAGDFSTVLLRRGTKKVRDITKAWAEYAVAAEESEAVKPLLVFQVPNRPEPDQMAAALDVIFDEWPELERDAIAHVFGEHSSQTYGRHTVPYISPERVQDASHIRVLLAKDAISTGWDCPRAEVMVSFRPARDETHITQLLGRMIRSPLARRIEGNELLNSVECILPRFDKQAATRVLELIVGGGDLTNTEDSPGQRVLIDPVVLVPNEQIPEQVWTAFDGLPTDGLPRKHASPIQRVTALAHALASDRILEDAGRIAHADLHGVLDGIRARYASDLLKAEDEIRTVRGGSVRSGRYGLRADGGFVEIADDRAIMDAYRQGARVLTPDIARSYVDRLSSGDDDEALLDAHVTVAGLGLSPQTRPALDAGADALCAEWLNAYRVAIKKLPEARQSLYAEITTMSTSPQTVQIAVPRNRLEETRVIVDGTPRTLDSRPLHLLSDLEGRFPVEKLNPDELAVLDKELARGDLLGWYRNPTGGRDALGIAYQDRHGDWRLMRPDFVFFADGLSGVEINIVDPHGSWLPDALAKLRGMARWAEEYADRVHRVEAISRIDGHLLVLDLKLPAVREAIREAMDASDVYRAAGVDY